MKRVLSGIQATGNLHIGNYLGAMKPWVKWQNEGEAFFFIPNLHSLNVRPSAEQLIDQTLANVAWLLAVGIDPNRSAIYLQSQISAHSELCWILQNFVTMGELSRMTQYKDKAAKRGAEGELVALFTYPVLMAADILLYDADIVPVGSDQKQHVELTRDIAERFNNLHGETFKLPEPAMARVGARVMSLQDPESKMSKSDADQSGNIMLLEESASAKQKLQKAVTDSGTGIELADDKPAIANLLQIYAGFSDEPVEAVAARYAGKGYAEFKSDLAELVSRELSALQGRFNEFKSDPDKLWQILEQGRQKAAPIAAAKLVQVKEKLGLL